MIALPSNPIPKYADNQCAICKDDYLPNGNQCLALRCGHLFHQSCMKEVLDNHPKPRCPLCRAKVHHLSKLDVFDVFFEGLGPGVLYVFISSKLWEIFMVCQMSSLELCKTSPSILCSTVRAFFNDFLIISWVLILVVSMIYRIGSEILFRSQVSKEAPYPIHYYPKIDTPVN